MDKNIADGIFIDQEFPTEILLLPAILRNTIPPLSSHQEDC
jgi:hypothetical protein